MVQGCRRVRVAGVGLELTDVRARPKGPPLSSQHRYLSLSCREWGPMEAWTEEAHAHRLGDEGPNLKVPFEGPSDLNLVQQRTFRA